MRLPEGIHGAVPMADYIADPCEDPSLSTGVIKALNERSAAHAWLEHPRLGAAKDDGSNAADDGTAVHQLTLGGDSRLVWIEADDYRTKDARVARDLARSQGRVPMLLKDRQRIELAAESAAAALHRKFPGGKAEQTLIWEEGGVWHRSRPDWVPPEDYLVDLKTTSNADQGAWIKTTLNGANYDLQAVHGIAGMEKIEGRTRDFVFLLVELEEPFATSFVGLAPEYLDLARLKRAHAIKVWRECLSAKKWPAYSDEIHYAQLPTWKAFDFEARRGA